MQDGINEFYIKSPKFVFGLIIFITVISAVCLIGCICAYFIDGGEEAYVFLILAGICLFLLGFCGLMFYIYFKEVFYFKDEVYTYIKPFNRAQSVAVKDIAFVTIKQGLLIKVVITDKNGYVAMNFLDDGTSFRSGEFVNSLIQRKIEIKYI